MSAVCAGLNNLEDGMRAVEYLLRNKADVNQTDHQGRTALLMACHYDILEIAEILINHGADLNKATSPGQFEKHVIAQKPITVISLSHGLEILSPNQHN